MNILLTADLHLTDNPRDSYRWGIFDWLVRKVRKHDVRLVGLLGDLTDAKDKHAEGIVNRLVDELEKLGKACPVIFNPGNHDGIQEGRPYFRFTNHIHNVTCLTKPMELDRMLFLPHTKDPETQWKIDFTQYNYIFCHQTFEGCLGENGFRMSGISPAIFGKTSARVYSGDIHTRQIVSRKPYIEYVGAPYRIRFGDNFDPRVLLVHEKNNQLQKDLYFPTVTKFLVELKGSDPVGAFGRKLQRLDIREGDQIKVRVLLPRASFSEWPKLKGALVAEASQARLDLCGLELRAVPEAQPSKLSQDPSARPERLIPGKALAAYAGKEQLPQGLLGVGQAFLKQVMGKA